MTQVLLLACALSAILSQVNAVAKVDPRVYEDIENSGTASIILHFRGKTTREIIEKTKASTSSDRQFLSELPRKLKGNADRNQAGVLRFLEQRQAQGLSMPSKYFQIWAVNAISMQGVDQRLLAELESRADVVEISADRPEGFFVEEVAPVATPLAIPSKTTQGYTDQEEEDDIEWGVRDVGAPQLWEEGYMGQGVIVGVIDSGIRAQHEAFRNRIIPKYGWFDGIYDSLEAYDFNGHGSHVAGIIVGPNGIGVAPNASLVVCQSSGGEGIPWSAVLKCGQYIFCPGNPKKAPENCRFRPKIINMSWAFPGSSTAFEEMLNLWIETGMIVIAANGNFGKKCSTTGYPASLAEVISVGSLNQKNQASWFSSRGPVRRLIKPDIAAPGENIWSVGRQNNTHYLINQGTSMAAPHVAGVAALLASADPSITQEEFRARIYKGAKPMVPVGQTCGRIPDTQYPNNIVGRGKIYAPDSMF